MIHALLWLAATPADAPGPVLFRDPGRDVEVRYEIVAGRVDFSAYLPAGWTFSVKIDGDQDGKWGHGAGLGAAEIPTSRDLAFGQDRRGGVFCVQYILASQPGAPDEILASSECDAYPSRGWVELSQLDRRAHATITYRIPEAEVFGSRSSAHLQACVWDTGRWTCQHSPARPFVLARSAPAAIAGRDGPGREGLDSYPDDERADRRARGRATRH